MWQVTDDLFDSPYADVTTSLRQQAIDAGLDDFFDDSPADSELYGVRNGRYRFPPPPGIPNNPRGWMRMTNLASAFSDQERLQKWLTWKTMIGLRDHEIIFDEWMAERLSHLTEQQERDLANEYAERARKAARADHAARRGTARHEMMDTYFSHGERTGTRAMLAQLDSLIEQLDRLDLEVMETEFYVWHPLAGGTMGKADARVMCRRTGQIGILDLKTQRSFWTWQEICGQLYGYESAPMQWHGPKTIEGEWRPTLPGADRRRLLGRPGTALAGRPVALVAHMPQAPGPDQLPVTIKQIPLDYGREVLECAARNVELRSRGRSTALARMPVQDFPAWG